MTPPRLHPPGECLRCAAMYRAAGMVLDAFPGSTVESYKPCPDLEHS